ncbi:hypothetical protein PoB_006993200 [Plakobranchus ocellatus]|uniref:Uncharacterized protein n=1 Tax=Plakobranchus ocellatus TaxID=259542 RepID=A0AAV4DGR3_9GAST|nr:hypothetical protein PoB_006993200 [Plakobranchus ocellatus]
MQNTLKSEPEEYEEDLDSELKEDDSFTSITTVVGEDIANRFHCDMIMFWIQTYNAVWELFKTGFVSTTIIVSQIQCQSLVRYSPVSVHILFTVCFVDIRKNSFFWPLLRYLAYDVVRKARYFSFFGFLRRCTSHLQSGRLSKFSHLNLVKIRRYYTSLSDTSFDEFEITEFSYRGNLIPE